MSWNSKIIELISLHVEDDKDEYQKFFKSALDKFGIKSPTELGDDKKKEFFNYIDKGYDAKNESTMNENPAVIATAARMAIQNAQGKKVSVNTARQKDYKEKDPKAHKKASSIFDKIKDKFKSKKKNQSKGQKLKTTNDPKPSKSDAQKYSDLYGGGAKVESTKAYAQTLAKMAKDRQLKNISKKDKDMLMKIAQMMKTANEGALSSKIKKAIMIAIQMSGNMTGAVDKIEKIAKGLSKDKKVVSALRLANESKINEAPVNNSAAKKAVKDFLDKALKLAGIKVLKHQEMKPGTTRAMYGCFYTVKAASGNDVLPFYVYKNGKIELGVSSKGFWPGKYGELNKVVKQLKDFKSTDLDKG